MKICIFYIEYRSCFLRPVNAEHFLQENLEQKQQNGLVCLSDANIFALQQILKRANDWYEEINQVNSIIL